MFINKLERQFNGKSSKINLLKLFYFFNIKIYIIYILLIIQNTMYHLR